MIENIILGQNSLITKHLSKHLKNTNIFSANNFNEKNFNKIKEKKRINLIFNNFYPSKNLNTLNTKDYKKLCALSLEKISMILEKVPPSRINKIIYTSSASVYRIPENLSNQKNDNFNRELYSSFKLAAEKMILNFANKKKKKIIIF